MLNAPCIHIKWNFLEMGEIKRREMYKFIVGGPCFTNAFFTSWIRNGKTWVPMMVKEALSYNMYVKPSCITIRMVIVLPRPQVSSTKQWWSFKVEEDEEELEWYDLSALYRLFKYLCNYIHTMERKERQSSDTKRPGIQPRPSGFLYVPAVQLRYTGPILYVPIRRTNFRGRSITYIKLL